MHGSLLQQFIKVSNQDGANVWELFWLEGTVRSTDAFRKIIDEVRSGQMCAYFGDGSSAREHAAVFSGQRSTSKLWVVVELLHIWAAGIVEPVFVAGIRVCRDHPIEVESIARAASDTTGSVRALLT
jgi:hypothetical protein